MYEWEDYYKILQVDFLAESEIIRSAYKKLAKKYHPDINKNSVSIDVMKKINVAYEILIDIDKRSEYNIKWLERHAYNNRKNYKTISIIDEMLSSQAKLILNAYFNSILNKNYSEAYNYISDNDKKYISINEFIKWQGTVSKVFQLSYFECEIFKCYKKKILKDTSFDEVIEFNVKVVEKNLIMGRIEEDEFIKQTVIENNKWSVFIGYKKLSPLIEKFERLCQLTNKKQHRVLKSNLKIDFNTGFLTQKGLSGKIFIEIERYKRYGNIFSVVICQIIYKDESTILNSGFNKQLNLKKIAKLISQSIRILDIPCIWNNDTFLILLPETKFDSTLIVIEKIKAIIKNRKSMESVLYSAEVTGIENNYKNTKGLLECINYYLESK